MILWQYLLCLKSLGRGKKNTKPALIFRSFGTVWKVQTRDKVNPVAFAVKHIKIDKDQDISEIENEIGILKACSSPYVVSYYGVYRKEYLLWVQASIFFEYNINRFLWIFVRWGQLQT